ncbi:MULTISPECIES: DUF3800 domain-containing protein [Gordonia]|uniref:DUF3800 domain-containing protein n=1 Tax=Gordonia sihwensis NBRC 108236 TaxID=1223544 RepID=L7LIP5_9ACTN|nr:MULTISPECIES: DUF3800 domain-containing protein [Gordonia]AUH68481.1 DUF3800 domain-containing protein [Gordonia sp. YC-JH1]GAC60606.1 hypothetical protein GSI01S_10_01980 [Gordonia sihwensis NBRC 108236]
MTNYHFWEDSPDYDEPPEDDPWEEPLDPWEEAELFDLMEREREAASKPSMHVFIDDSGDGGFKLDKGSSSHLVMAACVFRDPTEIEHLADRIEACRTKCKHRGEFKYSKGTKRQRDHFFEYIEPVKFDIRTIVIDKAIIYSPTLRSSASKLKSFAIRMLLTKNYGQINNAKVIIDGLDIRGFGIPDAEYLMRKVHEERPGVIDSVRFGDSTQNVGLQLADMVAGAINAHVKTHAKSDSTHFDLIRPRTYQPRGSLWRYK